MSNELQKAAPLNNMLAMWRDPEQLKTIRSIYAKDATDLEFKTFVELGIATGLNPFLREIWLVKYDKNSAAQIFIGRDGYRKSISTKEYYRGHHADAVYSNDDFCFDLTKGEVRHTYNLKDRGKLLGAYSIVHMANVPRPFYVFVELHEYDLGHSLWKTKKATMIKKVAECQAIRMADSCTFGGTYSEDEMPEHMREESKASQLNKRLELKPSNTFDGEIVNPATGEVTETVNTTAEAQVPPAEQPLEQELLVSVDTIKTKIQNADNAQMLVDAVDLVNSLPGSMMADKKELMNLYRQKQKELG
ncbi:hypothetical protein AQUSIP_12510 [Aquicella siphonis]|uniref:Phage recombination protein Bet n=1 Tax=Aquicella siphonis TaxID=254247 RepID=A0A5E4PG20_9COXI|nr:phage recombination protein Bet [Aquicella siphonis]VVC75950.1 hypothetical protein AQUSIP_12510 [Aquicella siphonis]